jgi:hypothetical protein
MPRRIGIEEEWEDDEEEFESDEGDTEFEAEKDDEETTTPCPYCRRQIHEDSQRCPYCENYLSTEDAPASAKPRWFVVGFLLCSLIVLLWILWSV